MTDFEIGNVITRSGPTAFLYTPGEVHPELIAVFERAIREELIARFPKSTGGLSVSRGGGDVLRICISALGYGQWTWLLTQQVILESVLGVDGMARYIVDKWVRAARVLDD